MAAIKRDYEEGFIVKTGEWMVNPCEEASESHPEFASARTAGDNLSWIIKLDTTDITPATAPDLLLDDAQFSVGGHDRRFDHRDRMQYLIRILNDQTSMQLTMLARDDRPPQYRTITSTRVSDRMAKGHFKVPPNWNYFDAEIQAEFRMITKQLLATGPPK
ncbi:hypothetical protein J4E86_000996 [Alternaria arbusti]|uniref:uncharacterized protein n=1 Tax=Alternaria arbusti TaxID=232088 RepID=UPI00221EAEF1|nr:uncharacterized protein J4E86_000996 [Alternaria arbusti]KAI4961966.1 hypothetical protein J4E86_000996 [Alternaria arbusti]